MKDADYWDRFLMTGSISDFLSYKNARQDAESAKAKSLDAEDGSGGHSHAGIYRDYGDGAKG